MGIITGHVVDEQLTRESTRCPRIMSTKSISGRVGCASSTRGALDVAGYPAFQYLFTEPSMGNLDATDAARTFLEPSGYTLT